MKSIKADNLVIENPVILAPQAGVTDAPLRELVESFGVGMTVSEMVASEAAVRSFEREIRRMQNLIKRQKSAKNHPLSVQIFGANPEVMAKSAVLLEEVGADMIDINMGCPVKKIVKGGGGADLMRNLPLATEIIRAVKAAVKIPISVKMRLGWDEQNLNAALLAHIAESEGAAFVAVHGRTRNQFYTGTANWEEIRKVKEKIKIPLIANGDIFTVQDAKNALEITAADGLMIGRGIYGRPWFCADVISYLNDGTLPKEKAMPEIGSVATRHLKAIITHYEKEHISLGLAKKHMAWYAKGMRGGAEYRSRIVHASSTEVMQEIIKEFFGEKKHC